MDLTILKIIAAVLILIMASIAGYLPFHKRLKTAKGFEFPRGEALAAGVFLGAGLIHMLPNADNHFKALGVHYSMAFLLCGVSFLVLLLLEHFGTEIVHKQGHCSTSQNDKQAKSIAVLSFVMLSIHSLFSGAALGLTTNIGASLIIFIAILAHKWAASFSLAVQLNKSQISVKKSVAYFVIFALMTPLGIFVGDYVTHLSNHSYFEPIFASLAAGTFLYIGTLHGLKESVMVERCCNLRDFSFVIIGFALMAVVAIYV
jgi:zinc transporter ZupT